jgi:hypothetical protein
MTSIVQETSLTTLVAVAALDHAASAATTQIHREPDKIVFLMTPSQVVIAEPK